MKNNYCISIFTFKKTIISIYRYGRIRYSLEWAGPNEHTTPPFTIDEDTGQVVVSHGSSLDRETRPEYKLLVRAKDSSDDGVTARLKVIVDDFNDNSPIVTVHRDPGVEQGGGGGGGGGMWAEVREARALGEHVTHFGVDDLDSGDNGRVHCELVNTIKASPTVTMVTDDVTSEMQYFRLVKLYEGQYELVTAVVLDRETTSQYDVTLKCQDNALRKDQRLTTTVSIKVKVQDVNDNSPIFQNEDEEISVFENLPLG